MYDFKKQHTNLTLEITRKLNIYYLLINCKSIKLFSALDILLFPKGKKFDFNEN